MPERRVEYRSLGKTGLHVPVLSAGSAAMGDVYGPREEAESVRTAHRGIDLGITYWDTAPYYGATRAEEVLGKALVGRRDEVLLSTKTGRYGVTEFDFTEARIRSELDRSLQRLRTDHVDILIAHDVEYADPSVVFGEGIPALQALKREGKTRVIGVSGYPLDVLRRVTDHAELDVVLSYCHNCLIDTTLIDYTRVWREQGLGVISASPVAMGLLTSSPPDWHPAPEPVKRAARQAAEHCERRGASLPFLAVQFALRNSAIDSTLTGAARLLELEENVRAMTTPIDDELLAEVREILAPVTDVGWSTGIDSWRS